MRDENSGNNKFITPSAQRMKKESHTIAIVVDKETTADAAVLCSLICEEYSRRSRALPTPRAIIVRIVADCPELFGEFNSATKCFVPVSWTCHEKQRDGGRWATYLGAADSVFPLSELKQALHGRETFDDGGMVDSLMICSSSLNTMQIVATAIGELEQDSLFRSPLPFVISCTGSFRALDWLARRVSWGVSNGSRHIALCAFSSPLWYCRVVQKGVVLSVPRTNHCKRFLVRPMDHQEHCYRVWENILGASWHSKLKVNLAPSKPMETKLATSAGAQMLLYQLQDASLIFFPCMLASKMLSKRNRNNNVSPGCLMLSMMHEFYRLFQQLLKHMPSGLSVLHEDTVLVDLVGNRLLVESSNNTLPEILERISQGKAPFRCRWMLHRLINRQARREWQSANYLSPFFLRVRSDCDMRFVRDSLECGLLLVLGLGQLIGMEIQNDFITTVNVVQLLQPLFGKSYMQQLNGGILWNENQLMDTVCPRGFAYSSLNNLLLTLAKNPIETHKSWIRLNSKI